MAIKIDRACALIIVDMQNDFMPSGSLPIPDSDKIIPVLNKYIELFVSRKFPIFATRDWHPPDHKSFKQRGGMWAMHCVRDTKGAEFHPELKIPRNATIISKATDADREAYSAFERTELARKLEQEGIKRVLIGGVATDYCVKSTALDAVRLGFDAVLLEDAVKGINNSGDAVKEMQKSGVRRAKIEQIGD
jgi:nicotinamidase/pyrazinamidase